ncbi:hypothetical protein LEP1GSC039_2148 [Leptospira santarosai str. 2000027870]|nr:hypothetical protein LEP1GSC039_2148 [Leptospira santarosai str. 2000027870]
MKEIFYFVIGRKTAILCGNLILRSLSLGFYRRHPSKSFLQNQF